MASVKISHGIRVEVKTTFVEEYSDISAGKYLYCYKIRITNKSTHRVQILRRHWIIIDGDGDREEVRGEGVVGKKPILNPNDFHEYLSFSQLKTDFGTMEGSYQALRGKQEVNVKIGRFYLATNLKEIEGNRLKVGQIVHHKLYHYRGVITDFDVCFMKDEKWYQSNRTQPNQNRPWYYVLVDGSNRVCYVAEENLKVELEGEEVHHPLLEFFFTGFENHRYTRNKNTWEDLYQQEGGR